MKGYFLREILCLRQASVLENLRLAVRSQLGFASIRLPGSGRHRNFWRRLFSFTRSRSPVLVPADAEEGAGGEPGAREPERAGPHRGLLRLDSDDAVGNRRDAPGAAGGPVTALARKTPPTSAVEAVAPASRESPSADDGGGGGVPETQPTARGQLTGALGRVTRGLRWVRDSLGRPSSAGATGQNNGPLRNPDPDGGSGEDEDDVELLVPASDSDSNECFRPLLGAHGSAPAARRARLPSRDGPCERCGMVHTAQVPDACLEAAAQTETGEDEPLLPC